jgi:PmbA protein
MSTETAKLADVSRAAVELARKAGAQEVAAEASRARNVEVKWRDGKLEQISEATSRSLDLRLYVDGRYAGVSTSDLRPEALRDFVGNAIALTRKLAVDPHRSLPDPKLYDGRAKLDLELEDPSYTEVSAVERRRRAEAMEAGARASKEAGRILSVTTSFSDALGESHLSHSNGFDGDSRSTSFWMFAEVSMKDGDGRRPEDYAYAGTRFFKELASPEDIGKDAAARTAGRLGAKKGASAVLPVVVDHRVSGRLLSYLMGALGGRSLQQKRSFLEGKLDQPIGSKQLEFSDDPLVKRGFGSRLFDGEGISSKPFPIFSGGVLKNYYIDSYYAKKLDVKPTTGGPSNLGWKLGTKDRAGLMADIKDGILITNFLGGNSNSTTGDLSLGIAGFRIRNGALAEPISEMNLSGNHLELWKHLAAVGNDPYPYSAMRTPTLLFDGVQIAGA